MSTLFRTLTVAASALFTGSRNEICYDKVGCFNNNSPWTSLTRPLPLPHGPQDVMTEIIFNSKDVRNLTIPVFPAISKQLPQFYRPRLKTYILGHGFATDGYSFDDMAEAILENKKEANIISINWNKSAGLLDYAQAVSDIRVAAAVTKLVIDKLINLGGRLEDFHLIGHSLGAHLLAYVGKKFKGKIGRLTGLDPAGPLFEGKVNKVRFSAKDALYTEALHTNVGQSGIVAPIAQIDYYFNAGLTQPGCLLETFTILSIPLNPINPIVCAHSLSYLFYKEAMKNPDCLVGKPISTIRVLTGILNTFSFANGRSFMGSNGCGEKCVKLSLDGVTDFRGSVVVATKKDPPYCLT